MESASAMFRLQSKKSPRAKRGFRSEPLDEKCAADVPARRKKKPASAGDFVKTSGDFTSLPARLS
jgi:hypothetical protein